MLRFACYFPLVLGLTLFISGIFPLARFFQVFVTSSAGRHDNIFSLLFFLFFFLLRCVFFEFAFFVFFRFLYFIECVCRTCHIQHSMMDMESDGLLL